MVNNPSENSRVYIGFVVDREDPTKTGGHRIFCPQLHGKDVKVEDLPFCRFMVPPGQGSATTNFGALDYGQMVYFKKDKGEGGTGLGTIVGLPQTKRKSNNNMPGNTSLVTFLPQISEALNKELPVRIRPDIEEAMENGARVRKVKEKGKNHKHTLLDGIAGHGAAYPLNGTVLPQIKNVSTGVEAVSNVLTSSLQSLLPGLPIQLSNILSLIPEQLLNELTSKLDPEVLTALTNTTSLMSSVSTMAVDGAQSSGITADPTIFAINAVKAFTSMTNTSDVANIFSDLMSNPAVTGLSTEGITTVVNGPFGPETKTIDPITGAISSVVSKELESLLGSFGSLMSSLPGAGGSNLFGDSAGVISQMGQRFASQDLCNKFKQVMEQNISTSQGTDPRKTLNSTGSTTNSYAVSAGAFLGAV
jgi:hypothetical protein